MNKEDEYRANAAETVELANRAPATADKGRLLRLAEKWLDLADRARRLTKRQSAEPRWDSLLNDMRGSGELGN